MVLSETWVEEKNKKKVREKLPGEVVWGFQTATRMHAKGRAKRGMLIEIRKKLMERGKEMEV